jgi:hypothetical protein
MATATVLVTGNTYPVKDSIKALGGRWDATAKGWRVPADKASEAQALVAAAPKSSPRASSGRGRNWDPNRFNGYGRSRGGYAKSCVSGGNCSSIGSGKCCGGHDCDGF